MNWKKRAYKKLASITKSWRICTTKKSYDSLEHATVMARRYKQRIYKCQQCGKMHLTRKGKFKDPFTEPSPLKNIGK